MAIFPGVGNFETTFLPDGISLAVSTQGDMVSNDGDGLYLTENSGNAWSYLSDPAYWAENSAMAISPNFDQDDTIFIRLNLW